MAKKEAPKEESDEEVKPSGGGGLMTVLPLAVIGAGACFGMVWMATEPAAPPEPMQVTEDMCKPFFPENITPEELQARASKYVSLEPIAVSLRPDAGAKHLMMSITLGVPSDATELTDVQFLRLRDQFLEMLRKSDSTLLTDPEAMPTLRDDLLKKAKATLGRDEVHQILITDFLLK